MTPKRATTVLGSALLSLSALASLAEGQIDMVLSEQKISDWAGGFDELLQNGSEFGNSIASLGDLDGDTVGDLIVGAWKTDCSSGFPWTDGGAVWVLFLNTDGTVKSEKVINAFTTPALYIEGGDHFGSSVAALGDLDGGGWSPMAVAVGAYKDHEEGFPPTFDTGSIYILYLSTMGGALSPVVRIGNGSGGLGDVLDSNDYFGSSVASLGDLDGWGGTSTTLAVGAIGDDDGGSECGAVWILGLSSAETVQSAVKISAASGGFTGDLDPGDHFGASVACIGDADGDGVVDLAVGAPEDDDGGANRGAVWILYLRSNGTVKAHRKISADSGDLGDGLSNGDAFGSAVAGMPDVNLDGIPDLAVGAMNDDDGGTDRGAVWMLFLDADESVRGFRKIRSGSEGFGGSLSNGDSFGCAVAAIGDHKGDGMDGDIAVGAMHDDDGGTDRGALWGLFLRSAEFALSKSRNPSVGGHTNPDVYTVVSPMILGGSFVGSVDTPGYQGALLIAYATPLEMASPFGNILVNYNDPLGDLIGCPCAFGNPAIISVPVPMDPGLLGMDVYTQAVRFGGGIDLTNAQDQVVGF